MDTHRAAEWVPIHNPWNIHHRTPSLLGDAIAVTAPGDAGAAYPAIVTPDNSSNSKRVLQPKQGQARQGQANRGGSGQAQVPPSHNTAPTPNPEAAPSTPVQPPSGAPSAPVQPPSGGQGAPVPPAPVPPGFNANVPWPTAKLRVRVIDGRSQQPISGAEVVVIETEQRVTTGKDGYTPYVDAPVFRNPRFRPLVAELHGQLAVIAYKNGYRDSIHMGIRMHEGLKSETTVWMYKIGPGDDRIEPVLYQVPYHHLWLVELADRFRSKTQPGEGPQRP